MTYLGADMVKSESLHSRGDTVFYWTQKDDMAAIETLAIAGDDEGGVVAAVGGERDGDFVGVCGVGGQISKYVLIHLHLSFSTILLY